MKQVALTVLKPTCGDCRHFQREGGEDWGFCKANPPQAQMMEDQNGDAYQVTFWPQIDAAETACGVFKAWQ